jgi:hypothetical protein
VYFPLTLTFSLKLMGRKRMGAAEIFCCLMTISKINSFVATGFQPAPRMALPAESVETPRSGSQREFTGTPAGIQREIPVGILIIAEISITYTKIKISPKVREFDDNFLLPSAR